MKYLLLLLFIGFGYGQNRNFSEALFTTGQDTVITATVEDTLDWRGFLRGATGNWTAFTDYITAVEKGAGNDLEYSLADETAWKYYDYLQLRIRSSADTLESKVFNVGDYNGAITVFIVADTTANNGDYSSSRIGGN